MRTLVFGDDGSPGADVAWLWISEQHWPGWRVEILSAVPPPLGPPPGEEAAVPHPWDPPEPRVPFDESGLEEVVHLRAEADPRYALARREDASLVVVGSTGTGLLKSLHLGSTAEYLLHLPPAPLVVAKHAAPVRSVVAAVDGSDHAQRAVEALAAMPWRERVERIVLVTVREGPDGGEAVERAAAALGDATLEVVEKGPGHPVTRTVLDEVERTSCQLVVLGTRGRGPILRALAGSTATAVTRVVECSVLLAHAP